MQSVRQSLCSSFFLQHSYNMADIRISLILIIALDLDGDGIKAEVAEYYLNWEASAGNHIEWKTVAKNCRRCCLWSLNWKALHFNGGREMRSNVYDKASQKSALGSTRVSCKSNFHLLIIPWSGMKNSTQLEKSSLLGKEYTSEFNDLSIRIG